MNLNRRSTRCAVAFLLMTAMQMGTWAQNPYMPLWEFIPDGEPYVFEDPNAPGKYRVYVYGSHDTEVTQYCGRDFAGWSAPVENLLEWRYEGSIFESKKDANGDDLNEGGIGDLLYAPDVTEVKEADGRKAYYLCPNIQHGDRNNMVAKGYSPIGPFKPCNWSKDNPKKTVGPFGFDPAIFVDDDGRVYGYWGFRKSHCAELDPNTMATVKPGTDIIYNMVSGLNDNQNNNRDRFFEASSIRKIKDKYVFIYSRFTNQGEDGADICNYTLAYCYSNNPMGPWTFGGTIIDGRGKEYRQDGTTAITALPKGNTHGSICEINGRWWVFYHRQTGTDEFSRQACVEPVRVDVQEGPGGYVKISEAEFTSQGFMIGGLDPLKRYAAGIACYITNPTPIAGEFPNFVYSGSYVMPIHGQYDGRKDIYDLEINRCPMVNNTSGSIVGYKYFNFSSTYQKSGLQLSLNYMPEGVEGEMDIYLDRPSEAEGGVKIGSLKIPATQSGKSIEASVKTEALKYYNGKHALFFVFRSGTEGSSLCQLNDFCFKVKK